MYNTSNQVPIQYHYTSKEGLFGILNSWSIRANKIEDLADETELDYGKEMLYKEFIRRAKNDQELGDELRRCAENVLLLPDVAAIIQNEGF